MRTEQAPKLVFIDDTATATNMTRQRGRAPKGKRSRAHASFGNRNTCTFTAALRHDGLTAPWVINGAMNHDMFEAYVETQLAPTLEPGDVVILDNLSSHKSEKAKAIVKERGAWFVFLPPSSPDSIRSKMHHLGNSEGVVPLILRTAHRALIMLARRTAKRDEPEADTHPMDGSADRPASAPRCNAEQPYTTECLDGAGDQS
jgi:hypothetical protein